MLIDSLLNTYGNVSWWEETEQLKNLALLTYVLKTVGFVRA